MATPPRTNNFDLIRLAAALQVVVSHGLEHLRLDDAPGFGAVSHTIHHAPGVIVFFAVSGFLIPWSFDRSPRIGRYAKNRLARIYPALWAAFAVSAALLALHGYLRRDNLFTPPVLAWIVGQVSVAQFYTPAAFREYGIGTPNGALWTIVVELQFYALVPLLLRPSRARNVVIGALAAASLAANVLVDRLPASALAHKLASVTLLPYLFMFLLGTAAYANFHRIERFVVGRAPWALAAFALYSIVASAWLGAYQPSYWPNAFGVVATVLLAWCVLSLAFSGARWSERLLRGHDLSYGIYLSHCLVINVLVEHRLFIGRGLGLVVLVAVTVAAAAISWFAIERPVLAWRRRGDAPPVPGVAPANLHSGAR